MSAKATTPARRTLATYPSHAEALGRAPYWKRVEGSDADVQVEINTSPLTSHVHPWAVTAAKTTGGGSS